MGITKMSPANRLCYLALLLLALLLFAPKAHAAEYTDGDWEHLKVGANNNPITLVTNDIITLSNSVTGSLKISENVTKLTIICENNAVINGSICIANRTTELELVLKNVTVQADPGNSAISGGNLKDKILTINLAGTVTLTGGERANNTDPGDGIGVDMELSFQADAPATLYATGGAGVSGANGGTGIFAPSAITVGKNCTMYATGGDSLVVGGDGVFVSPGTLSVAATGALIARGGDGKWGGTGIYCGQLAAQIEGVIEATGGNGLDGGNGGYGCHFKEVPWTSTIAGTGSLQAIGGNGGDSQTGDGGDGGMGMCSDGTGITITADANATLTVAGGNGGNVLTEGAMPGAGGEAANSGITIPTGTTESGQGGHYVKPSVGGGGEGGSSTMTYHAQVESALYTGGALTITSNAPFPRFVGLKCDSRMLRKGVEYTAVPGSTIVTISESYMRTLADGVHTFTLFFDNGWASTKVTVEHSKISVPETMVVDPPKTGHASIAPFGALLVALGAALLWRTRSAVGTKK